MAVDRFFQIAQDAPKPSDEQLTAQAIVRDQIAAAAVRVEELVPHGREQSLALTKLEEALMWAGKGIFN